VLTLKDIAENPKGVTREFSLKDGKQIRFRPLMTDDAQALAQFLERLSSESRRLSTFDGYDSIAAQSLCDAIGRYDKLRFVLVESSGRIIGLLELSLGLPEGDLERYRRAGINLDEKTDCRFGPTLADDYQGSGAGTLVFPLVVDVVRRLGKERMILWGGVLADNPRAIHYYEKHGFRAVGSFTGPGGLESLDMILDLE
jgi:GNAT superfamily N-acetyltransferase